MTSPSNKPSDIPAGTPGQAGSQLGLLLDASKDILGEEIRRTDRLESRARHMSTASGALFAVVMATTAGILNALLNADKDNRLDGWVIPVVGVTALVSIVCVAVALYATQHVQKLREASALSPDTIDAYISWAEKGHVAVAKNLITTYAKALRARRAGNDKRVRDLNCATLASGLAVAASLAQLIAVFVALLTK